MAYEDDQSDSENEIVGETPPLSKQPTNDR